MTEMLKKLPATAVVAQILSVQETDLPRVEPLLHTLLQWVTIATGVIAAGMAFLGAFTLDSSGLVLAGLSLLLLAVTWGLRRLSQQGHISGTINLLLAAVTLYITLVMPPNFLASGHALMTYTLPVAVAALLLTPEASWVWAVIATLAMVARILTVASITVVTVDLVGIAASIILFHLLTLLIWLCGRSLRQAQSSLRRQINQSRTGVEIGYMVTSALDTFVIIQQAVQMIQSAFDYYHVGLYTLDNESGVAVLADAAGTAASDLKEKDFRVSLTGITVVAFAISQKRRQRLFSWEEVKDPGGRRVQFTHKRFPTRAELVIPLRVGDRIFGALDVHSLELDAFSEADVHTLEGISGNIANALEGALLLEEREQAAAALETAYSEVEKQVEERTAELQHETAERERLQQEVIEAQQQVIRELSTPIIPIMDRIIVAPLIGAIDSVRAKEITRRLLEGIREHQAKVVIMDITGVPIVDSGVADHLNRTIRTARLKGARVIVTGISPEVAETIVNLGIDWSRIETLRDLQTGLVATLEGLGIKLAS